MLHKVVGELKKVGLKHCGSLPHAWEQFLSLHESGELEALGGWERALDP